MNAAQLAGYWGGPEPMVYRTIIFYVVSPILMLVINAFGVVTFGWIETFGGAAKILLVVATTFIMWIIASKGKFCDCLELLPMMLTFDLQSKTMVRDPEELKVPG